MYVITSFIYCITNIIPIMYFRISKKIHTQTLFYTIISFNNWYIMKTKDWQAHLRFTWKLSTLKESSWSLLSLDKYVIFFALKLYQISLWLTSTYFAKSMKMNLRIFYVVPVLFLCYCLMASFAMMTSIKNITTDQATLLAFKVHIADPQSILANNWSISYPICSWVGISCGARHHRVLALNLSDMGLGGTIPPHLGNLSFLVYLNFRQNNFHGHLPNELTQLHRLRVMNFAYNKLSGNFPVWIGILSKLQILKFRNNSLTGHIPDSLFNLSKLEELDSRFNNIDGNIPPKIANLSMLTLLNLGDNNLQGTHSTVPTSPYCLFVSRF